MLHCNMNVPPTACLRLDDLLGELRHARRGSDLGRLAMVSYCEVRRWAREVGEHDIAQHSSALVVNSPHDTRERFLSQIDYLITELEEARSRLQSRTAAPSLMQTFVAASRVSAT